MSAMQHENGVTENFTLRFSKRDRELLQKICAAKGIDPSDFVREAVRKQFGELAYLTEDEKKALGVALQ